MGLMHIYCGDGKGKTTAAIGLAVRAVGAGQRVCFAQLMKGRYTSELKILGQLEGLTVLRCDRDYGFVKHMTQADRAAITLRHKALLEQACNGSFDMVILDEFNAAYAHGLLDRDRAEQLIRAARETGELILTGRNPASQFLDVADYVSNVQCIKHPFQQGIPAREGIEF